MKHWNLMKVKTTAVYTINNLCIKEFKKQANLQIKRLFIK